MNTEVQTIDNLECILPICKDIIATYCAENGIDETSIHPQIWTDILDEICIQLIKPNNRLLKTGSNLYNQYDHEKVFYIYNIYAKLCRVHIQEICLQGFITFSGIDKQTILNWKPNSNYNNIYNKNNSDINNINGCNSGDSNNLSTKSFDLHQKIVEDNEQSLAALMLGDKGIPTKYLAKLNRYHSWNMPGVSRETANKNVLTVSELPKLSLQNTQLQLPESE